MTELVEADGATLNFLPSFDQAPVAKSAKRHVPRWYVLRVITMRVEVAPGLEHQRAQPALAQLLCCPASGDSRADDYTDEVVHNIWHFPHTRRSRPARQPFRQRRYPTVCTP